jgi:hypothetical protein
MCIVAWAESAESGRANTYRKVTGTVEFRHVAEVLRYDFARPSVHIQLLLMPHIDAATPVYVHCIHRRSVHVSDCTSALARESGRDNQLLYALGLLHRISSTPTGTLVRVRAEDGKELAGLLPASLAFSEDQYNSPTVERQEVPFTSVRFGPLASSQLPYVLSLSLLIEGLTFDRLIAVLRNHCDRYLYNIAGPDIVARDIELLDLYGLGDDARRCYDAVVARGLKDCGVKVKSYDILTCDAPSELYHYVRVVSRLQQHRFEQSATLGHEKYIVNSWHGEKTDFLIQRVSLGPTCNT